jgi:protocatechuate 3,4-dioxygenase beta subunit
LASLFLAAGAGLLTHAPAMSDEPKGRPASPQSEDASPAPAPGRMWVTGRVLDPQGKPVPGAMVMVHARNLAVFRTLYRRGPGQLPIGDGRADDSGRFRLDAPRTSSARHEAFGAVALAPGYGAAWVELDPDAEQPTADITLRPEQVIHGRLFDLQGRPVPNVTLSVAAIGRSLPPAPGGSRSRFEGVSYWSATVHDFPAWPRPVTTDPEGRFTLRGVGRDLRAYLTVHHPRFALQRIEVPTDDPSASKPLTAALVPAQVLTGRVSYADTGKPVPHAPLEVISSQGRVALISFFKTDAEGHFRVIPPPADRSFGVTAYPPEGQPYLTAVKRLEWPKGALEQSLDLALPRGVLIHGKVTEAGSGQPVPGAIVDFAYRGQGQNRENASIIINTAADGSFQVGVAPSPGCLFVKGPSDDYMLQTIGSRLLQDGQPGGGRTYAHAFSLLDLKPGMSSQEVHLVLRRGVTVHGQVLGPDGQPVRDAWMISRIILNPRRVAEGSWDGYHLTARDSRFEIHGLDPDVETPVYFLEPKRKLGATVQLSGKSIALMTIASQSGRVTVGATVSFSGKSLVRGPINVRLEPCGAARARVVDAGGKPVAGRLPDADIRMVDIPGPPYSRVQDKAGSFFAGERPLYTVDPTHYQRDLVSDPEGRLTFPALIPGATYRVIDYSTWRDPAGPQVRKEFTIQPGETLDLGDIRIEKPPR